MHAAMSRWVVVSLGLVYVVWGSTYYAMRVAVAGLPPLLMGGSRYLIAGGLLFAFLKLRGAASPTPAQWKNSAPVGLLLFLFGNGAVAIAEQHISSGVAAAVCGSTPLWAAAMGPLFKERSSAREWAGLMLGFLGVVVMSLGAELRGDLVHAAILLAAPIGWAAGSLLSRKLEQPIGAMGTAAQMLWGGVIMALGGVLRGERLVAAPPADSVVAFVYLIVFGSLVGFSAYAYLLRHTRPSLAMSYSYVNPAIAVAIGAVLGREVVGLSTVAATGLIIAGTLVLLRAQRV